MLGKLLGKLLGGQDDQGGTFEAVWNGKVIAESDDTVRLEGNPYFPRSSVRDQYLKESDTQTICPWKGRASYYTIVVNGAENRDAAWYYPSPSAVAAKIKGRVAFWKGVKVRRKASAD